MKIIETNNSKNCKAYVGKGIRSIVNELAPPHYSDSTAVIISDDVAGSYYAGEVEEELLSAGRKVEKIIFPSGEEAKSFLTLDGILNRLADDGITRRDTIIALGGGAVCDMAGFAASVYMRGIGLINIPTTLFAAVNLAVGGRNSINIRAGKNLAGTIYQPDTVIVDCDTFNTFTHRRQDDGYAEIVKLAVVTGGKLAELVSSGRVHENIEEIVSLCIETKSRYVAQDEHDPNHLQLFNLGDTLTGVIRKCSGYAISRGQATAAALMITAEGSYRSGMCGSECRDYIEQMLKILDVETVCEYSAGRLWYAALEEYGSEETDEFPMIVPLELGHCELKYINKDKLFEVISHGRNAVKG